MLADRDVVDVAGLGVTVTLKPPGMIGADVRMGAVLDKGATVVVTMAGPTYKLEQAANERMEEAVSRLLGGSWRDSKRD